jgi:hypothetical protein
MKKLILFTILFLSVGLMPTMAQQTQDSRILVDPNDLPASVLNELKQKQQVQNIEQKVEQYGRWAGMGKEVGTAINEGLTAVKDVSIEFSESDLGLFTMGMIAWNVMGEDLTRIIIGLIIMLLSLIFILRSYFKTCTQTKVYVNGRVPLLMRPFKSSGEYTLEHAQYSDGGGAFLHFIALGVMAGITYAIMFA